MTAADCSFDFDGERIPFRQGQSVGAALVASGRLSWRSTRVEERPRGIFCGIGVCFDCLVVAGGHPNRRACLTAARDGMTVATQPGTGWTP